MNRKPTISYSTCQTAKAKASGRMTILKCSLSRRRSIRNHGQHHEMKRSPRVTIALLRGLLPPNVTSKKVLKKAAANSKTQPRMPEALFHRGGWPANNTPHGQDPGGGIGASLTSEGSGGRLGGLVTVSIHCPPVICGESCAVGKMKPVKATSQQMLFGGLPDTPGSSAGEVTTWRV